MLPYYNILFMLGVYSLSAFLLSAIGIMNDNGILFVFLYDHIYILHLGIELGVALT